MINNSNLKGFNQNPFTKLDFRIDIVCGLKVAHERQANKTLSTSSLYVETVICLMIKLTNLYKGKYERILQTRVLRQRLGNKNKY